MQIQISEGIGNGPTELAAFDQALMHAGVANYNLIYLSSVLPPGSEVIFNSSAIYNNEHQYQGGSWGDRLYVVMAQKRVSQRNQEAWAGIGWIQDLKTKKGLLVEHEGHSESEVRADIEHSLNALAQNRNMRFGAQQLHVVGTKCTDLPACALVVAVYESTSWKALSSSDSKLTRFKLPLKTSS